MITSNSYMMQLIMNVIESTVDEQIQTETCYL